MLKEIRFPILLKVNLFLEVSPKLEVPGSASSGKAGTVGLAGEQGCWQARLASRQASRQAGRLAGRARRQAGLAIVWLV